MKKYLITEALRRELQILLANRPTLSMELYTLEPADEVEILTAENAALRAALTAPTFSDHPPAPIPPAELMPFRNAGMP